MSYTRPLYKNFARTTLASGIDTTDTTLTVTIGHGARFPLPLRPGDFIPLILQKPDYSYEIVWATARSTDSFTIVRAQEGTSALSFSAGHLCVNVLTSRAMDLFMNTYWGREENVVTYVDASTFTLPGDETTRYQQNRALYLYQTSSNHGWVTSSSYNAGTGLTTVVMNNVTVDSGLVGLDFGQDRYSAPKYTTRVTEADLADDSLLLNGKSDQFLVPTGGIIMWSGAIEDIPAGFLLCNGTSGTPDLRGRFVIGATAFFPVGSTDNGHIPSHTHTGPSHTHTGPSHTHTGPSHTHTISSHTHTGPSHSHGPGSLAMGNDSLSGSLDARRIEGGFTNFTNASGVFGYSSGGGSGTRAALRVTADGNQDRITISHTHNHSITSGSTAASGTGATGGSGILTSHYSGTGNTGTSGTGNTGASGTGATGTYGSGSEVIAKYYALCYIMKS